MASACLLTPKGHPGPSKRFTAIYDAFKLAERRAIETPFEAPTHAPLEIDTNWPDPRAAEVLDCFSWHPLAQPEVALANTEGGCYPTKDRTRDPGCRSDDSPTRLTWFRWYSRRNPYDDPPPYRNWVSFEGILDVDKENFPPMAKGRRLGPFLEFGFGVAWGLYWHPGVNQELKAMGKTEVSNRDLLNGRLPSRMLVVVRDIQRFYMTSNQPEGQPQNYRVSELLVALEYIRFMGAVDDCAVLIVTIFGDEHVRVTEARWEEKEGEAKSRLVLNLLPVASLASEVPTQEALDALARIDATAKEYVPDAKGEVSAPKQVAVPKKQQEGEKIAALRVKNPSDAASEGAKGQAG